MKFTIIVPVYNSEKFIQASIDSILSQNYKDWELICVDDKSTDNTVQIIKNYTIDNPKIKIIQLKKNSSQHVARIIAVKEAKGDYILFLDSDDFLEPNALEILDNYLDKNPVDILEYAFQTTITKEKTIPVQCDISERVNFLLNKNKIIPPTLWNKVYNTDLLKQAYDNMDEFYAIMAEDFYQSIIISYYTKSYYAINTVLYNYSEGTGVSLQRNTTADSINKKLNSVNNVIKYTKKFFEKKDNSYSEKTNGLEEKLFNDMVYNHILGRTKKNDIEIALSLLPKYFNSKIIQKNKFKIKITKIKNNIKQALKNKIKLQVL